MSVFEKFMFWIVFPLMFCLIGGLAAPNQGLFPKYDAGVYTEGRTNMVVSRGVGNSLLPFRVNNPPEVVLVELHTEENGSIGFFD